MPIAQSKRKLIAATALFIAVGALTGAIATGGAATISFAQTEGQQGGDTTGQEGGQQGAQARIVRTGTVVSTQDPLPGHETHQAATILPLRQDGSVYSGVITYTASAPVEVVIPMVQTLNETEQSLLNVTEDEDGFGTLLTSPLDNQTSIAIHIITPTYGDTPIPSASIPFTGNALWLHTIDGTPFVANYAVSAQVLPAESQNVISNVTIGAAAEEADAEEADAEEADAEDEGADAADEGADGEDAEGEEDGAADEGGAVGPGTPPAGA